MILAVVASITLLMAIIYTKADEGDANAMEEIIFNFCEYIVFVI